jgi:hypothetical protein
MRLNEMKRCLMPLHGKPQHGSACSMQRQFGRKIRSTTPVLSSELFFAEMKNRKPDIFTRSPNRAYDFLGYRSKTISSPIREYFSATVRFPPIPVSIRCHSFKPLAMRPAPNSVRSDNRSFFASMSSLVLVNIFLLTGRFSDQGRVAWRLCQLSYKGHTPEKVHVIPE